MADYLNILIHQPELFISLLAGMNSDERNKVLNSRYYDAYDGTLLHLVAYGVALPTNKVRFDDEIGGRLVTIMMYYGACPFIEDCNRHIPYEIFVNYRDNPNEYKTLRCLLRKTTDLMIEGDCKREYYTQEDLDYYFDRAY
jgi:hypothetical protein